MTSLRQTSLPARVSRVSIDSNNVVPLLAIAVMAATTTFAVKAGSVTLAVTLIGSLVTFYLMVWTRVEAKAGLESLLLAPSILSVFQNVYLLPVAKVATASEIQLLLVLNYALAVVGFLALLGRSGLPSENSGVRILGAQTIGLLIGLGAYGAATWVIFGTNTTSALASLRNFSSPLLFFALGLLAASRTHPERYIRLLLNLAMLAIAFGIFERFSNGFWISHDLAALWEKKSIEINAATGLPGNFYSSELIGGVQVRRMAGPFADPVNFGTFLLVATLSALYMRRYLAGFVCGLASILALSKGALLGWELGLSAWAYVRRSRFEFLILFGLAIASAAILYGYAVDVSTGSASAHIGGLTGAFAELPAHPLGAGLGGSGVLAGLFSNSSSSISSESGLGVLTAQLGIVGLLIYGTFFISILRAILRSNDLRVRSFGIALLLAFLGNMAFNEVALSPNSCAPYFVILGLLIGQIERTAVPEGSDQSSAKCVGEERKELPQTPGNPAARD